MQARHNNKCRRKIRKIKAKPKFHGFAIVRPSHPRYNSGGKIDASAQLRIVSAIAQRRNGNRKCSRMTGQYATQKTTWRDLAEAGKRETEEAESQKLVLKSKTAQANTLVRSPKAKATSTKNPP